MTWLERPDVDIENIEGRDFANRIRELAKRLNIDLEKADKVETREILKGLKSSLSDEIIETRESPD